MGSRGRSYGSYRVTTKFTVSRSGRIPKHDDLASGLQVSECSPCSWGAGVSCCFVIENYSAPYGLAAND